MKETTVAISGVYKMAFCGEYWMIWKSGCHSHMIGGETVTKKVHVGSEKYIKNIWKKLT